MQPKRLKIGGKGGTRTLDPGIMRATVPALPGAYPHELRGKAVFGGSEKALPGHEKGIPCLTPSSAHVGGHRAAYWLTAPSRREKP